MKVDNQSGFTFSDATIPEQMVLLQVDETDKLSKILQTKFKNRTLSVKEIQEFVENETAFLDSHMKTALKELERIKEITVKTTKSDGAKRRKDTFPEDVIVTFNTLLF